MAYFRTSAMLAKMLELFRREDKWLICINADPDAMGAAMALKRIMSRRVDDISIAKVNEVKRPDNLAYIRYTHIVMEDLTKENLPDIMSRFNRFAIIDSQPHHHILFDNIPFSIVIDHHPLPEVPYEAPYKDIRPQYGATCTMMTEYLYNLKIRPGKLLATGMQFGIKTDTANFDRHSSDIDLRAYRYLSRFSDPLLLSRIGRSEYHLAWLEYFAKAITNLYGIRSGQLSYVGRIENPDILVVIADQLMRVYEITWTAVCGIYDDTIIVIFRGDGISRDLGKDAALLFGEYGSAGGHKTMARAEFPLSSIADKDPEIFLWQRFKKPPKKIKVQVKQAEESMVAMPLEHELQEKDLCEKEEFQEICNAHEKHKDVDTLTELRNEEWDNYEPE